jgi:hypothetical protein
MSQRDRKRLQSDSQTVGSLTKENRFWLGYTAQNKAIRRNNTEKEIQKTKMRPTGMISARQKE